MPYTSDRIPIPPTERLTVTITQAAELLSIGRTLAYEAAQRGDLPTIRIGRRVLVPVEELKALIRARQILWVADPTFMRPA